MTVHNGVSLESKTMESRVSEVIETVEYRITGQFSTLVDDATVWSPVGDPNMKQNCEVAWCVYQILSMNSLELHLILQRRKNTYTMRRHLNLRTPVSGAFLEARNGGSGTGKNELLCTHKQAKKTTWEPQLRNIYCAPFSKWILTQRARDNREVLDWQTKS